MALRITDACINCGACALECPNHAIYEGGHTWSLSDGTNHKNQERNPPSEDDYYFIVGDKCTECVGFHDTPQCAFVCPADCCLPDRKQIESPSALLFKKQQLHD